MLASPTAFRSQGQTQPLPLPEEGVKRYTEEMVVVSRFSLRSGSIGKIAYTALNRDRYWLSALGLLAAFALYSGVGAQTTMGMGQVRQFVSVD